MYEGPVVYESHVTDYFLIGMGIVLLVLILLLILVSLAKIFTKADKKSWAAFVPFYNLFVLLEVTHLPSFYFLLLLIPVIQLIPLFLICRNLADSFRKDSKFSLGLFFLPFVFYPLLAFSKDTYVGINEEVVEEVVLADLIKENVDVSRPSMILGTNQNVSVGTTTVATSVDASGKLQADTSILQQNKPPVVEYIECPVCKNKVKKGAPVCFICGHKF